MLYNWTESLNNSDVSIMKSLFMLLNVESMRQVAQNVKIPVASGERIYSRWGYRPFFEARWL